MIQGDYNLVLVAAAIIVAFFSSHTATELAVSASRDHTKFSFFGAVLTFGVGAWASHFIALLAFDLVGVHELFGVTFSMLSLSCILVSTGLAAWVKQVPTLSKRLLAALTLTVGLATMHEAGVYSLVLHVPIKELHRGPWWYLAPIGTFGCCYVALSYLNAAREQIGHRFSQTITAGTFLTLAMLMQFFVSMMGTEFVAGPISNLHSLLPYIDSSTPTLSAVIMMTAMSLLGAVLTHSHRVQHETAARLEEAYKEVKLSAGAKGDFLAVMSHEIRTPLTAVMGYTELLIDGCIGKTTVEQQETLLRIDESSKHLLSLIQQVLDISLAEKGHLDLQVERCDVCDLIKRTVSIMDQMAKKKGLTVHVNLPHQRCLADTDIGKLRQVIINLVGNAIKFTNTGSVTIELGYNNTHFTLQVRDTGIGIREEDHTRVFEPFYQGEGTIYNRSREGAGLGLTISREIVLLLQGTIDCRSKVGEGSVFSIKLPRVTDVVMVA